MRTAKTASKVKMFRAGPEIAEIHKGERVITKLSILEKGTKENLVNVLKTIYEPTWCHIFEENQTHKEAVLESGFRKIGTKYSTFSDIVGVYYKGGRKFIPVVETENINMCKTSLSFDHNIIDELVEDLITMNLEYTNHNSNYNKKKSWQALSLMGFETDSTYVDKNADLERRSTYC